MKRKGRGRPSGRAHGTLPDRMLVAGWPYVAELDIPECGLIQHRGLPYRLGLWLKHRDTKSGGGIHVYRLRFRSEEEADSFATEFADVGARRGV